MADQSITGLEDAPSPLVGAWYLPIAQQGLRSRRILHTDLMGATSWASLTGTPTTLAGYGITDAVPAAAISAYALRANNLSDLASAPTARTNLGLGALATLATVGTPQIDNDAVAYAKIQNVSAATRLLGRGSAASAGDVEELTVGAGLSLSGTVLTATIAAANPSGTIGLSAVNGSAGTFLRSDGAPALSQAIAPTWIALHTFDPDAGGIKITGGAPNITGTYLGLTQKWGLVGDLTSVSTTAPEGTAHFHMETSVGSANPDTAYKTSLSATINVNSGSANGWAQSNVATVGAGGAKRGGIALELDLNNFWGDYAGTPTSPYLANLHITGLNTNGSSGGYATAAIGIEFAQNANPMWNYGIHMGPSGFSPFLSAVISIECDGNIAYQAAGDFAIGVDLSSGTYSSYAFFSPGFLVTGAGAIDAASLVLVTPLAVAEGGTGASTAAGALTNLGHVAWTSYTPSVTATSGTFTTVSATGRSLTIGKTVWFENEIAVTTNGSAAAGIVATLPSTPSQRAVANAYERSLTGKQGRGVIVAGAAEHILTYYDGTYMGGTGANIVVSGCYEIA